MPATETVTVTILEPMTAAEQADSLGQQALLRYQSAWRACLEEKWAAARVMRAEAHARVKRIQNTELLPADLSAKIVILSRKVGNCLRYA